LKIKASGNAVDVEALPGKVQIGHLLAFHTPEVDLFELDASAGNKLVLI
jgi:hypothetical protein